MKRGLVWLRRDLRIQDHAAICAALQTCEQVFFAFIFDQAILDPLKEYPPASPPAAKPSSHHGTQKAGPAPRMVADRRVHFIWHALEEIHHELKALSPNSGLISLYGISTQLIPQLAKDLQVQTVFINHDYEPAAMARDAQVKEALFARGIDFLSYKDQVIFEKKEVLTGQGGIFSVFTPYKNAWLKKLSPEDLAAQVCFQSASQVEQLAPIPPALQGNIPTLESMGFLPSDIASLLPMGASGARQLLKEFLPRMSRYSSSRDYPSVKGPSYLSTHLRFGTISIRTLVREAHQRMLGGDLGASTWLSELIWRDFYMMILANHPRLASGAAFKPAYDQIAWETGPKAKQLFDAWCAGMTGYPLVDAAMRQLNATGYMHNRLRMVAACFLIKDLGIDWRWGEKYFADLLNDFDLSANNGGWQWASSSGCDAQPYFRIFNPITQSKKFDSEGKFIRKYCPELELLSNQSIHAPWLAGSMELSMAKVQLGQDYPWPIVQHEQARDATLRRYGVVKAAPTPGSPE